MNLNIDRDLFRQQVHTLTEILARCDDDGDSIVRISYEESEDLEGLWNLCTGLLHNVVD